jgi:hypothetical protein
MKNTQLLSGGCNPLEETYTGSLHLAQACRQMLPQSYVESLSVGTCSPHCTCAFCLAEEASRNVNQKMAERQKPPVPHGFEAELPHEGDFTPAAGT